MFGPKFFLTLTSIFGALAVLFGAFGAHALRARLEPRSMEIFQTAVSYQFYHCFALGLVSYLLISHNESLLKLSGLAYVFGIVVFSGSLYLLTFTGQKFWGAITPIGGLSFIVGWICFGLSLRRLVL